MSAAEAKPTAQDMLQTFTSPDPEAQLQLETNALYIVLTLQSKNNVCHWALYLHIHETHGWVFHITNMGRASWEYRCFESTDMKSSPTAISVVKIAEMLPDMHEALQARIGTGSSPAVRLEDNRFGRLSCRTWLLEVLYQLDNEGYISIRPGYTIRDLEHEASTLALNNIHLMEERGAKLSDFYREIASAFCVI